MSAYTEQINKVPNEGIDYPYLKAAPLEVLLPLPERACSLGGTTDAF
jgi:hypothetical protein